jgi:hypothetical protein
MIPCAGDRHDCLPALDCYNSMMSVTEPLAKTFAQRAVRARMKAEQAADQRKADRQKLRAQMYQRFAFRLKSAGNGVWTKE